MRSRNLELEARQRLQPASPVHMAACDSRSRRSLGPSPFTFGSTGDGFEIHADLGDGKLC
jgi:hypothetical protein